MPLLKKKKFERAPLPTNLRDDEEVFYCAITNEIFRDYEEFSERMFLCNSMVWTCSMTGKYNLTYSEAVESEENARQSLKEFPSELKIPILYLATKTRRTGYIDASEDVFLFAKDRYFIGENVETSFTGTNWKDSHILQVIAPTDEQVKNAPTNGTAGDRHFHPPASLFKYEIEHLDAYDQDISEIMIVDYSQIRRKRGLFSRERSRMFLKQYLEQDDRGILVIKKSAIESFGLNKVSFDQIFDGPLPEFDASKRFEKYANGKKTRQETLHEFLTKNLSTENKFTNNNKLLEKMRKLEEDYKIKKQQRKDEKLAMKQKKKEDDLVLAGRVKDWHKPKEDLELVDQKKLPVVSPVKTKISDEFIGDVFMILEFVRSFSKVLDSKAFFSGGLNFEIMERALTTNEVDGPFSDLVQMFLMALFSNQDEERNQYKTDIDYVASTRPPHSSNTSLQKATYLATAAACWSDKHQGLPLGRMTLHSGTTTEILRLHLLSSGARINENGARWRFAQRGGYTSEDDPGLALRLNHPHILKALAVRNVVELPIGYKLKIISCLIDQLLTYADVRDIIEDKLEKVRHVKLDLKMEQAAERRREQEFLAARVKLRKEMKDSELLTEEIKKLEEDAEQKKVDNEYKIGKLIKDLHKNQILMGQDRAFRRYLKLDSLPGFFTDAEEHNPGSCLSSVIEQNPELIDANPDQILTYIKKTLEETSSDKENSSPKSPKKVNGTRNSLMQQESCENLMMCSSDPESCVVHSKNARKASWSFFFKIEEFDQLLSALNKRGYRENDLQKTLSHISKNINYAIDNTPGYQLNMDIESQEKKETRRSIAKGNKYSNANLGYPPDMHVNDILHHTLVDYLLELEEKIHSGNLGRLVGIDRVKWRNCLENKNYTAFDKTITTKENLKKNGDNIADSVESAPIIPRVYQDPGKLLGCDASVEAETAEIDNSLLTQTEETNNIINCLAIALVQLANAVESKFLTMPLGGDNKKGDKKKTPKLDMWEQSLLASTSFSQVFLHYTTLDSCILWKKSKHLVRCMICRKSNDSQMMLLCDECNEGHHLYCLRPALESVPEGYWFCKKCAREKQKKEEKAPVQRRRIFRHEEEEEEEEGEEEEEDTSGEEPELTDASEEEGAEEEEETEDTQHSIKVELCRTCGSGGETIRCDKCSSNYHIECVEPPLRRIPRGSWCCSSCKRKNFEKRYYNGGAVVVQRTGFANGRRHCAAKALYKIHDFAKSLRQQSESEDSDLSEVQKRPSRRDEVRSDLPLHNSALHELLADVMKDNNAWPFLRPVVKNEVPDYYDVITKPMDFGTIKYKLNMGEYKEDANLMSDAVLVFQNCNTYNHTDDDVFKCGVELLKLFKRKCQDLGLKLPEEMNYDDNASERPKKKRRTK